MTNSVSSAQAGKKLSDNPAVIIIGVIAAIIAIVAFFGGGNADEIAKKRNESRIIGTWQDPEGNSMTFFEGNSFQSGGKIPIVGNYYFTDRDHIRLDFGLLGSRVYEIKFSGNSLTMKDEGGTLRMTKVK